MATTHPTAALRKAAELLAGAKRILVLSGAGLSKASGIPTYRDTGGLWESGDNLKFSHIDADRKDPGSFASFWSARTKEMSSARPNAAHLALKELQWVRPSTRLVTQNVDGLLQKAGCSDVLELHGNLMTTRCGGKCGSGGQRAVFGRCLSCYARMRPNVVMFGEALPEEVLLAAETAARLCEVILVVGTSAVVNPAAGLPVIALRAGAKLIVMDVEPPQLALAADVVLEGKAEELLPELLERMGQISRS